MTKASLLLLLVGLAARVAADGMLDPAFGTGGLVRTPFGLGSNDEIDAIAVTPDGRYVVAGVSSPNLGQDFIAVARYLPTGELDPTFGGDGRVVLVIEETEARSRAAAVLPLADGRIVLAGHSGDWQVPTHVALVRLQANGDLDPGFGKGGWVRTPIGESAHAVDAALLPDGRIVVVGASFAAEEVAGVAVRYHADGALDASFGSGGIAVLPSPSVFGPSSCALLSDGRLAVGGSNQSGGESDFAVVRLLADGAPDPSFDGDGLAIASFSAYQGGRKVLAADDASVIVAGPAGGPADLDFALTRFLANGAVDTSFGTGGLARADGGSAETATSLIRLPDQKLMVGGYAWAPPVGDFVLARFLPSGAQDTSFGTGGLLRTDFGSVDFAHAVAYVGVERLLLAGYTVGPGADFRDFALARYIAATPVALTGFAVE